MEGQSPHVAVPETIATLLGHADTVEADRNSLLDDISVNRNVDD